MRRKHERSIWGHTLALMLGTGGLIYGCAGSSSPIAGGGGGVAKPSLEARKATTEAQALALVGSGDFYEANLSSDFPNGSKGLSYTGEYNMTGSKNGISAKIMMRAAYTATDLYIQLEWNDSTFNDNRRRFLFNGPGEGNVGTINGWSSQLNDDKFSLAFDINGAGDGTGSFTDRGCAVACHGSMNPTAGSVDLWHWKMNRSNRMGYVNDQWADPAGRKNDGGDPIEVRNWKVSNDIAAGPGNIWNPAGGAQVVTLPNPGEGTITLDPAFHLLRSKATPLLGNADSGETLYNARCSGCHSPLTSWNAKFAARGLNQTDAQLKSYTEGAGHPGAGSAAGMSATDWDNLNARFRGFAGVPGYMVQPPTGSNADLVVMNSKTVYAGGRYRIIVRRKLVTGNSDDVQFNLAAKKEYVFGVGVMDNDGKNHAGKAHQLLRFLD